jgi:two-component system, OmpR family, catabolic regulation response regulator CreB
MVAVMPQILVIEDHVSQRESLIVLLQNDSYRAHGVTSGQEGLAEIKAGRADVVLLDVGLPDCNGFDLFHEIRKISNVPVIFMTARGDVIDKVTGLELGADDYIPKPAEYREVVARIRAILRRVSRPASFEALPHFATPLRLDPDKRRIHLNETLLDLTPLEYGILRILIEHPGRVFTRDYLLESLWPEPQVPNDRSIDQHIKTLRKKLSDVLGEDIPVINTHRNAGYSLRDDWS